MRVCAYELLALERRKSFPYTYSGENVVRRIAPSLFIGSSSNLQVTRTKIKHRTSSDSGQIGLFTLEFMSAEKHHIEPCPEFDRIFVKRAGSEDSDTISDEFDFGKEWTNRFVVTRP